MRRADASPDLRVVSEERCAAPEVTGAMGSPLQDSTIGRLVKRCLDICLSLPIVVLLLPPLAVAVRLGQWWQSPGPLFFRQCRRGRFGEEFSILKFRTMNVPDEGLSEISDDPVPRIFPIGRLLRNTKLDEIPQFVNVLMGAMSVVGPRPHHLEDCSQFERQVQGYARRTIVKPGITGLAQVTEYRGDFEWNCVESRVEKDLTYIRTWSLSQDFRLIFSTVFVVCQHLVLAFARRLITRLSPERTLAAQTVMSISPKTGSSEESSQQPAASGARRAA